MDALGSPDRVSTARADIFTAAGWLRRRRCGIAVVTASAGDRDSVMLVACYQNIRQVIYKDKIQQFFAGMCDSPTIFGVMLHNQAMGLCNLLEAFVVVGIATAGILDRMNVGIVMAHLMQKGSADSFNRSCQRSSSDIDFMCRSQRRYPCIISQRKVTIGFWRGLNGYGWL